ncbi:long-chain fatty acid--CoA ligase [Sansalvadorimonas sp. 2012CJ34-2]|uniref:Long-chain fatty acid--CoA ligase n=1 Tax=Parendozoicomonas callyspongiae TaxID=2942213 RepID=A0ABT0PBV5_9GAMM|nr:long-chain fatty acid--CoA ligase [Sansalvadorimonas sp. 2012CJ34-2]MCL6268863.1 long-chain fatty acid--CoA ligase [Sansalvadorimonas sp. 2012CJ34-2]
MTQEFSFHLVNLLRKHVGKYRDRVALRYANPEEGQDISWTELGRRVEELALALIAAGVQVQDKVAICSRNMPEWTITDLAILFSRAVTVPIYPTNTAKQVSYILRDAGIRILFVGEQEQFDSALEAAGDYELLERIVAIDRSIDLRGIEKACYLDNFIQAHGGRAEQVELEQRLENLDMTDLVTLIYTSGTTGEPKGVMLDYQNFAAAVSQHDERLALTEDDISISFLPLSHIFERAWTFYVLYRGATNVYMRDQNDIKDILPQVKPTVMCAVPRLYEKMHTAILSKVEAAPESKKKLFYWAVGVGEKCFKTIQSGKQPGLYLKASHALADKLVFSRLRMALGGRTRFLPCSGARLDDDINLFFQSIGIHLKYGYGLSETTATVSCYQDEGYRFGTMGKPLPAIQVRIGEKDEIQVKSETIMRGYYNKPEATAEAFTEDGWFRTGDAGHLDDDGNIIMTERLKELMKTSGGKYIAPQLVESTLIRDHFVEQVAIVADTRKYVSALIVPAFEALEEYAKSIGVEFENRMELIRDSQIQELFNERLGKLQKELARFEQVKKFTLLSREFSLELGEITPTLKLRRKVIMERFKKEIEAMYPGRR